MGEEDFYFILLVVYLNTACEVLKHCDRIQFKEQAGGKKQRRFFVKIKDELKGVLYNVSGL